MSLFVVNPTPSPKIKKRSKSRKPKTSGKPQKKGEEVKKRRVHRKAANPTTHKKRRYRRNPTTTHRTVHHYKAKSRRRYRRNPEGGGGSLFSELMSKDGLFMIAGAVGTPTLLELGVNTIMPSATGMTRSLVKAGIGVGAAWAVHRFVNKKAGLIIGLVSIGAALTELLKGQGIGFTQMNDDLPLPSMSDTLPALPPFNPLNDEMGEMNGMLDGMLDDDPSTLSDPYQILSESLN